MSASGLSRRGFLATSLGTLTAAGLPMWYAKETLAAVDEQPAKRVGANDKLQIGLIGTGDRCKGVISPVLRRQDCEIVAVCDVDQKHMDEVAFIVAGGQPARKDREGKEIPAKPPTKPEPKKFKDYRDLVGQKDIDLVFIVTPDHWHTLPCIAAAKAGKDIYIEKPLTLTVAEGQALVKAVKASNRVLQVGSQQRSDARFRLACELVRNGRIGKIKTVETRIGGGPKGGPFKEEDPPTELDWDFWLGQTPKVPYIKERCHYQFRWWYEYSGGKMTDWGAHHNDIAQWALGMDESGPVSVMGTGEASTVPNTYNTHTKFEVTYEYPNGTTLICKSDGENGVHFEGEEGWIFVSRSTIRASDKKIIEEPLSSSAVRLYKSNDHMGNFLSCVRSREKPICHESIGHRSVSVCHIGAIALRFFPGKKLTWDPSAEKFSETDANQHLAREMRAPWKLEV
jgi:predicted dehydrogenase